jgi:hypothetical protein
MNTQRFQQFQQMEMQKQQEEFQRRQQMAQMQELQMKEAFGILNMINYTCFEKCITDLTTNKINPTEEACIKQCGVKFVKHSQRIAEGFQKKIAEGGLGY